MSARKQMNKSDLVRRICTEAKVDPEVALAAVNTVLRAMRVALAQGGRVELRGFGILQVGPRRKGMARNPRTGEPLPIPAGRTVKFKPGKLLKGQ